MFVLLIGGSNGVGYLESVDRYSIANDRWEKMPELNEGRCFAGACSLGDKIYVVGGRGKYGFLNSIEKLSS